MTVHVPKTAIAVATLPIANARAIAWCEISEAVAEMRESLDRRIAREDLSDLTLSRDCRVWLDLVHGLADYLEAKGGTA